MRTPSPIPATPSSSDVSRTPLEPHSLHDQELRQNHAGFDETPGQAVDEARRDVPTATLSLIQNRQPSSNRGKLRSSRSPSLKAALSDPCLSASLKSPKQERSKKEREDRVKFEHNVRRYYFQLVVGCGNELCNNRLCRSCLASANLTPDAATIMSVQLASRTRHLFCIYCPEDPSMVPISKPFSSGARSKGLATDETKNAVNQNAVKPFLFSLFSSPPFSNILGERVVKKAECGTRRHSITAAVARSRTRRTHGDGTVSVDGSPLAPRKKLSQLGIGGIVSGLAQVVFGKSYDNLATPNESGLPPQTIQDIATSATAKRSKSFFDLPSLFSSMSTPIADLVTPSKLSRRYLDDDVSERKSFSAVGDANFESPTSNSANISQDSTSATSNVAGCPWSESSDEDDVASLTHLDLSLLEKVIATYKKGDLDDFRDYTSGQQSESADPTFLVDTLRYIFSSGHALGNSFLSSDQPYDSEISSRLNLMDVKTAYFRILSLAPRSLFVQTLTNAIEILLARIEMNITVNMQTAESLRSLLIVLDYPILRDQSAGTSILSRVNGILGRLDRKSKMVLVRWFSNYDAESLSLVVGLFQSYLSNHYTPTIEANENAFHAVKVLSLLFTANGASTATKNIISTSAFYNSAVSGKLDYREEHRQWKLNSEAAQRFSYFEYPFLFDPAAKSRIMHIDALVQMTQEYEDACVRQATVIHAQKALHTSERVMYHFEKTTQYANPYFVFAVRREHLVTDTFQQISQQMMNLKKPVKVKFFGGGEDGLDQGGLQKEFFQLLLAKLVDPAYGMFTYDEETRYSWIAGTSIDSETKYEQVGIILGAAFYNGVIVAVSFPRLFYKRLMNEPTDLEDVKDAFPALGRGLEKMLHWADGDVADVFFQSFEISFEAHGQVKTVPLVDGGENITVNNDNREEYVRLYVQYLTHDAIDRQFRALKQGFYKVCGGPALEMCQADELELLICGSRDLDFHALERGTVYDDGYSKDHPTIRDFWSIVHELPIDLKRKLLIFVTASDRAPILGLSELTFVIQRNGPNSDRLPTAFTCFGRLLLPEYSSRAQLKERLLTAIENGNGFGLV